MKKSLALALTLGLILPAVIGAQGKKTTDVSIQGHVYEPSKLEPSDELVARLRVPAGFRVQKFAELQNPRMLAVGPDGSVYVSQREPGLNELVEGAKYGWPYVYADSKLNPQDEPPKKLGLTNEDWARQSKEPVLLYTKSVVLMMEDPDASGPKPFVHWLVANLPADVSALPASLPKAETLSQLAGAVQGANHTGRLGYYGPHPPSGEPPHHYHFQIFALDTVLRLPEGFNRHALIEAMRGHVLAEGELIGTYQRKP